MVHPAFPAAFCDALNGLIPGWSVDEKGVAGPHGARLIFDQRHDADVDAHVDVHFIPNEDSENHGSFWDCVAGWGDTPEERASVAAQIWAATTGHAMLELLTFRGEFAEHLAEDDPVGLTGWHTIVAPLIGYGHGDSAPQLQAWCQENAFLPALAAALGDTPGPLGIKLLFGGQDVAEVRVNGDFHDAASAALAALDWPRLEPLGVVRTYAIGLHRTETA